MQKHLKTKALFFLGIFSMLLVHQAVPHQHHELQSDGECCEIAHDHHHDHIHAESNGDHPKKGFFHWFLEVHIHTNSFADVFVPEQVAAKKISVDKELAKTFPTTETTFFPLKTATKNEVWYPSQDKKQSPYSSIPALRGPPSLG